MNRREWISTWMREPLVQFLLGGLAVFLLYAWRGDAIDPESRTIVITEERAGALAASFAQTWQRAPTAAELDALIHDYVKEEVYSREAVRLGLEADDAIIRRRLRSKMEFLAQSQAASLRPDDATLQAWLDRHPERYSATVSYSFDQIYLNPLSDGDIEARIKALTQSLQKGGDWTRMGDSISLPSSVEARDRPSIAREFGEEFVSGLVRVTPGQWAGPVNSGFGLHLVRIRKVQSSGPPRLADVRQQVENDWRTATTKEREQRAYKALLDGYTIRIEKP
jgi:peptidyl-prolyl cis-trans isomerase C